MLKYHTFVARSVSVLFTSVLFLLCVFALPAVVVAQIQFDGLVPVCGTPTSPGGQCELCHVIALANKIIDFIIIYFSWPVAAVLFAYAGFIYITSQGNPGRTSQAKAIFTNVAIGFVIILAAWLIIDAIMGSLVNQNNLGRPWHEIACVGSTGGGGGGASPTRSPSSGALIPAPSVGQPSPSCQNNGCAQFAAGIEVKPGACGGSASCQVNGELGRRLQGFDSELGALNWRVTEAWPPTTTHVNQCHQTGHCVDANFTSTQPSAQNIFTFINTARSANLTGVYEVSSQAERDSLRASLVSLGMSPADAARHVINANITAPHFSVYCAETDRVCRTASP